MAKGNFARALDCTLQFEGGYVNNPADPGGPTNMGITQAVLADWRDRPVSADDVRALTRSEAEAIYRRKYWELIGGDRLPAGLDLAVFDYAVNSGVGRASRALQKVLSLPVDGIIGRASIDAAVRADTASVISDLCAARRGFLRRLRIFTVFGRGWLRRVARVERTALEMAQGRRRSVSLLNPAQDEAMIATKSFLQSRTVWANVIGLGAIVAAWFGFEAGAEAQSALLEAVLQIVAALSFIASTVFRIIASRQIG